MTYKYLSAEHISGFDKYKYSSVDTSPVSKYISHPFWEFVVKLYPPWLAPNVITLVGFLLVVLNYLLLSYYDYAFLASAGDHPNVAPIPRWLWLTVAVFNFTAHTLDGTDGKQARRTGTSGPLGELFDHGLDSWTVVFTMAAFYSLSGAGDFSMSPLHFYGVFTAVMLTFYVTHWEKYNSGVLYLPWAYDISQYTMVVCYLIVFLYGHTVVKFYIPVLGWTFSQMFETYMYVMIICLALPISLWNVVIAHRAGKTRPGGLTEALRPLLPCLLLFLLFFVWIWNSSCDIVNSELRIISLVTGTVFSNITCRLIVNGMSKTRCDIFNWLLVPLMVICALVSCVELGQIEVYLLWAYTLLAIGTHLHYGVAVVTQLADHLNIYVFIIGIRPREVKTSNRHRK